MALAAIDGHLMAARGQTGGKFLGERFEAAIAGWNAARAKKSYPHLHMVATKAETNLGSAGWTACATSQGNSIEISACWPGLRQPTSWRSRSASAYEPTSSARACSLAQSGTSSPCTRRPRGERSEEHTSELQ